MSFGEVLRILAMVPLVGFACLAQETPLPANVAAAGMSWNQGAKPALAGSAAYGRLLSAETGTYSFSLLDALPTSVRPFTVTTQTTTGVLQRVATINLLGGIGAYVPVGAGVSWSGENVGWAATAGGLLSIKANRLPLLGKLPPEARIFPNARVVRNSINGGAGYQVIIGILFGGGW